MEKKALYEPTVEQATGWQKFLARMGVTVFLGYGIREGWTGELPFYLFKCPRCKQLRVDYRHGHQGYLLCPVCK